MKFKIVLLALLIVGDISRADSTLIYDASTKRIIPGGGGAAYYYNPGVDDAGQAGHVLFDDVTVPSDALPVTMFQVTKVTVAISRLPSAASVQITPSYAQFFADHVSQGGPNDGPFTDPRSPHTVGSPITLASNGATFIDGATIAFGDGTSTLFNVAGFPAGAASSNRSFAFGLNFSTTDNQNGWTLAQQPNNLNVDWDYFSDSNFAEFTFGQDSSGIIVATQYLKVEGSLISSVPGDANFDGHVDIQDGKILAAHWNQSANYLTGDFNFDGRVDVADLNILGANWQSATTFASALTSLDLPVPEPLQIGLLVFTAIVVFRRR